MDWKMRLDKTGTTSVYSFIFPECLSVCLWSPGTKGDAEPPWQVLLPVPPPCLSVLLEPPPPTLAASRCFTVCVWSLPLLDAAQGRRWQSQQSTERWAVSTAIRLSGFSFERFTPSLTALVPPCRKSKCCCAQWNTTGKCSSPGTIILISGGFAFPWVQAAVTWFTFHF